MSEVQFKTSPPVQDEELNELFGMAGFAHQPRDFDAVLARSLAYVCAFAGDLLVGFVNIAWDGGGHGFLLDTCVHPDFRRQGVGTQLILHAMTIARERNLEWLHVEHEPALAAFYKRFGFRPTLAGVIQLSGQSLK